MYIDLKISKFRKIILGNRYEYAIISLMSDTYIAAAPFYKTGEGSPKLNNVVPFSKQFLCERNCCRASQN